MQKLKYTFSEELLTNTSTTEKANIIIDNTLLNLTNNFTNN